MILLFYLVTLLPTTGAASADGTASARPQAGNNTLGAVIFFSYILAALLLTGYLVFDIISLFFSSDTATSHASKQAQESIKYSGKDGAVPKKTQQNGTAERTNRRVWAVWFSGLALASFVVLSWNMLNFLITLYVEWARRRAVPLPAHLADVYEIERFFSSIWSWATDSNLFRTFAEDLLVDAPTWKHVQVALLYSYAWNVWMSMIGFKLDMRHVWAYFALDQILPVSFTQNLFCTALMLRKIQHEPSQPPSSTRLARVAITICFGVALFFMPATINTSWFFPILFTLRILLSVPFVVDQVAYNRTGFGKDHDTRRSNQWCLLILSLYGLCILMNGQQDQFKAHNINRFNYAAATLRNDLILGMVSITSYIIAPR